MAVIENAQVDEEGDQVKLMVRMGYDEFIALEGHMKDIHLFAEDQHTALTTITRRGPGSTRYILVPKPLRKGIPEFIKDVPVTKLVTKSKDFLIFTISKRILG